MTALSIGGLGKAYGQVKALKDVSLEVAPGELSCISGPDAAGKSTLLPILGGTPRPGQGATQVLRGRHLAFGLT